MTLLKSIARMIACAMALLLAAPATAAKVTPPGEAAAKGDPGGTIYIVVNDVPITAYTIEQRVKLLSLEGGGWQQRLQARLKAPDLQARFKAFAIAHNPKSKAEVMALQKQFVEGLRAQAIAESRPGLHDKAVGQLINESLQRSEAKRLGVLASEEEVAAAMVELARRNKKSPAEFEAAIAASGLDPRAFRARIMGQMSWQRVLGQHFRGKVSVGKAELEEEVATGTFGPASGEVELKLQRILIPLKTGDAAASVAGYAAADKLRQQARPCNNLAQLAKQSAGARFDDLGSVNPLTLDSDVRPILASAEAGSVPPPILTKNGIEIYGVCERTTAAQGETQRTAARTKIEDQKFVALSKGLLSDLCAAASIELRNGFQMTKPCGSE